MFCGEASVDIVEASVAVPLDRRPRGAAVPGDRGRHPVAPTRIGVFTEAGAASGRPTIGLLLTPSTAVLTVRLLSTSVTRWKPTMRGSTHRIGRQRIHEPPP